MQIPILIEPLASGGFLARSGEPFAANAEGATAQEAATLLQTILRERLREGGQVAVVELENGVLPAQPQPVEHGPEYEWAWQTMLDGIEESRRRADEDQG